MRGFITALLIFGAAIAAAQERPPSPAGAEAYIISPKNGATVHNPVLVQFGLKDLSELPTLKEFEELGRMEIAEPEAETAGEPVAAPETPVENA